MFDDQSFNFLFGVGFVGAAFDVLDDDLQGRQLIYTIVIHRVSRGAEFARFVPVTQGEGRDSQDL